MAQEIDGNVKTFIAGGTVGIHRRVKVQADGTIIHSEAAEAWIGTALNPATIGLQVAVKLLTAAGTHKMVATTAFACGADLYGTANGMVDDVGTGDVVGTALEAATALNDVVEVLPFRRAAASWDQLSLAVEVIGSSVGIGIQFLVIFRPTAAGTLAYTVPAGKTLKLISVLPCIKAAGNGDAAATAQLLNAANPITDAKSLNGVNDKVIWNFTTIDDAYVSVAAAAALNCTSVETGGNGCDCIIPCVCMWV